MWKNKKLFIAIDLPQEVLDQLARIQEQLKKTSLFEGSYPALKNIHLTLAFIGFVPEDDVVRIEAALDAVHAAPFKAQLGRLGIFMHGTHIKIVYVDLVAPELHELAAAIGAAVERWAKPEDRDFVSHITLARVKQVDDPERLIAFVTNYVVEPISFTVQSFALKESFVGPEGVVHRDVVKYHLFAR